MLREAQISKIRRTDSLPRFLSNRTFLILTRFQKASAKLRKSCPKIRPYHPYKD